MVDSQAALKALAGKDIKSSLVHRTNEELSRLGFEIPRLTLAWIKAHIGHEGNELADEAAKLGALEPEMSIKVNVPTSRTEINNKLKKYIQDKWHLRWTLSQEYKH